MKTSVSRGGPGRTESQERVEALSGLFWQLKQILEKSLDAAVLAERPDADALTQQLNELIAIHRCAVAAEEALDAIKIDTIGAETADIEAIRSEIGSQLDRLRGASAAAAISEESHAR
jgi:hypothetical protein